MEETEIKSANPPIINTKTSNIEDNYLGIPRIYEVMLMNERSPYTKEELDKDLAYCLVHAVEDWCVDDSVNHKEYGKSFTYSDTTDKRIKKILGFVRYIGTPPSSKDINWDRLPNRKERKRIKMYYRCDAKQLQQYFEMYNKYLGRTDVIEIFAKVGVRVWENDSWIKYKQDPRFLDAMDWPHDPTYACIFLKALDGVDYHKNTPSCFDGR